MAAGFSGETLVSAAAAHNFFEMSLVKLFHIKLTSPLLKGAVAKLFAMFRLGSAVKFLHEMKFSFCQLFQPKIDPDWRSFESL